MPMTRRIAAGKPSRPLTRLERVAVAVASAQPTHHLTITCPEPLTRAEFGKRVSDLRERHERDRNRAGRRHAKFAYVMTLPESNERPHAHLLLWESINIREGSRFQKHCTELGLGKPHISKIAGSVLNTVTTTSYVLGQQSSLWTEKPQHRPRGKHQRAYQTPQGRTLEQINSKLFAALEAAKSPVVADDELCQRLHSLDDTISQEKSEE